MEESPKPRVRGLAERHGFWAALVFLSLFAVYHANWSVLQEGDPATSAKLPIALLADHSFAFDADRFPDLFKWKAHAPLVEVDDFSIEDWLLIIGDRSPYYAYRPQLIRDGDPVPYSKHAQERIENAEGGSSGFSNAPTRLESGREYRSNDVRLEDWYDLPVKAGHYQLTIKEDSPAMEIGWNRIRLHST